MATLDNTVRIRVGNRPNRGRTACWTLLDGDLEIANGGFYPPSGVKETQTLMVPRAVMDKLMATINGMRAARGDY